MVEIVLGVLLAVALAAAAFLAARYFLLKRSLRQADRELGEIVGHLEDNRIVRLPAPDADLEALLGTVNRALAGIRGWRRPTRGTRRSSRRRSST